MTAIKPLVAGNWKMHGLEPSLGELASLVERLAETPIEGVDVLVCPPATLLSRAADVVADSPIAVGGQDCHPDPFGAHTGDISAEMLADAGANAVIVGHSERRIDHAETDALVQAKAIAAHRAGLTAILCIGETEAERNEGRTLAVLERQLEASLPPNATPANLVIAYEPVWAIGTGLTPETADIAVAHGFIRAKLGSLLGEEVASYIRILYGGSVKPANARDIFATDDVNGALVGGASLKAEDFYAIIAAYGTLTRSL